MVAIEVDRISKCYRLPKNSARLLTGPTGKASERDFWALKDISFQVKEGEVLGIIGRNGAGKSTLLKVLSRITEPTSGEAFLYGRFASLLEVGAGFHHELTGRENIYLNGSILGMTWGELKKKFESIVEFAGIGQFLDTPVKYYSSGMYVRLAFSVAAHLEPEILVVDEVLAVGDLAFQKKCLGKMEDLSGSGRTVIIVSHNLGVIKKICSRSLLVDQGKIVVDGSTESTIRSYLNRLSALDLSDPVSQSERFSFHTGAVRFTRLAIEDGKGTETYDFKIGDTLRIHFWYEVHDTVPSLQVYFALQSDLTSDVIASARHVVSSFKMEKGKKGEGVIEFPIINLLPREFQPYIWLGSIDGAPFDRVSYTQTGWQPIRISSPSKDLDSPEGYFSLPSKFSGE